MKIRKRIILVLFSFLTFSGCNNKVNVELGEKYKLINSASFNDLTIVTSEDIVIINGHILNYAFDSTFIIASQCPRDSVPGMESMSKDKYDEAFENSNFRQYWIINKEESGEFNEVTKKYPNVYGPFKWDEYIQKRLELGVPKKLKLKE
jgi:hypothetical protein